MSEIQAPDHRAAAARVTGRDAFDVIATRHGIDEAKSIMLVVVRLNPHLNEDDVSRWVRLYELNCANGEKA